MKKKSAQQKRSVTSSKKTHHSISLAKNASILVGDEMKSFLVHLILYLLINFSLFVYLYSTSGNLSLLYWIAIGWGLGVI
ncbi:MAG: 2TM domain-containing protein, partial [Patescibacteria group bacterium]|nr:2TM domain-containing protein [Patescibacteria group bacterium]